MVQSAVSGDEGQVFENLRLVSDLPMKLEMLHRKKSAPDEHTIRLRRVRGRGSACKPNGKFRTGTTVLSKPAPDPIPQLPNIAPPQVIVSASHPSASAQVVADTEKTPFEQRITGSTKVRTTLGVGYPIDIATVDVQNRVSQATALVPAIVNRTGVARRKQNPSIALTVNLTSSGGWVDPVARSNHACLQIADPLERFAPVMQQSLAREDTRCELGSIWASSWSSELQRWTFQQAIAKRKSNSTARPTVALNNAITDVGGFLAANRSGDLSWLSRDEPCCDVYLRGRELGAW